MRTHLGRFVLLGVLAALLGAPSAFASTPSTTLESRASNGDIGNGASSASSISADGRWVTFDSSATNLVPSDTNGDEDVFLRDRSSGQTIRISAGPNGTQSDGISGNPMISSDGRYVAFSSTASNLVPGVAPPSYGQLLYRYDRTSQALVAIPLPAGYGLPASPSISADGSRVAFDAFTGGTQQVLWWDASTGAVTRATQTSDGTAGNGDSFDPTISGDGNWVGFTTGATNLIAGDTNGFRDVYVQNLSTSAFDRVSVPSGTAGEANLHSSTPAIDFDGCIVAFFSSATNLVQGDTGSQPKVFVRDRCNATTEIASVRNDGTQAVASTPIGISDDGCRVVFLGTDIVNPAPSNGDAAVMHDRCTGLTSRLDIADSGEPGTGNVHAIRISGGTGRYVSFASSAANLVTGDANGADDVFVRDVGPNVPPVADLELSASGLTVTADASGSSDPDGYKLTSSINFGDGSVAQTGLHAVHTYAASGTYAVTATVTDADGASTSKTALVTVPPSTGGGSGGGTSGGGTGGGGTGSGGGDSGGGGSTHVRKLTLDRVALSHRQFAVVKPGKAADRTHGSVLTVRLSMAATVTLRIARVTSGRRLKGKCTTKAHKGKRCSVRSQLATVRRGLKAGTATITITGRVGAATLSPGTYQLTVSARTASGLTARPRTLTFVITKTKAKAGR